MDDLGQALTALLLRDQLCFACVGARLVVGPASLHRALTRLGEAATLRRSHPERCRGCQGVGLVISLLPPASAAAALETARPGSISALSARARGLGDVEEPGSW
jgi:hypothetical protein